MKVKAGEVDGYIARIDRAAPSILLYGPDQGLVTERARKALSAVVEDVNDPFRVVDIEADTLRRQPARLIEEVQALSLMGGRRVVRVRFAADAITKLFEPLLALEQQEALVVVEAGDLLPRSSLRRLFESARNAAALPCYRDEGGGLVAGIRRMLAEEGLSIDSDAMGYLQAHLGSDRELTRREIEKLALYMQSAEVEKVGIEDVAAVVGDSAALGQDDMIMATLLGDASGAAAHLDRLLAEGGQPVLLARALASTLSRLLALRLQVDAGKSSKAAVDGARPPVHFRRKSAMARAIETWNSKALFFALDLTVMTEAGCKTTGMPAGLLLRRLVHQIGARERNSKR